MVTESNEWKRPDSVPFPSIWRSFKGRKEINGILPSFWVQDVPEEEIEMVVNCMAEKFCADEPLTKCLGLVKDSNSVQDMRNMWNLILRQKVGLVCYMENSDTNGKPIFAGVNCTHVKTKLEKDNEQFTGKHSAQVLQTMELVSNMSDPFEFLETDALLSGLGLYVLPEFRGQGIGLEIILARDSLCKAVGIKAAVTVYSSYFSQVIADRAGYRDLSVISYEDLKSTYKIDYPGLEEKHKLLKYMYKKF